MKLIETRNLSYSYDQEHLALNQVNISIEKGKVTAILGGNGAGKSTLFLNLNGVLTPSEGEVYFDGKLVTYNKKNIMELRKRVGIVFQDPNDQLFSADVLSDISFGPMNLGLSKEETKKIVDDVIMKTGIQEYVNKPTHALSFGQKKRVAIAGVLAMKPDIIILDEPTAGLDPSGVSDILKLLTDLQSQNNLTIIISTHDIDIVPLYCDYAYVLDHGKVVLSDTSEELFTKADELRSYSLRLPRIAHLMEILKKEDHMNTDERASTISKARKNIRELLQSEQK
ncbi:ATP-binding cassette domain-containing protein [Paludicola sp. MB14-C6]|uniref:ATP-binding cassette domain-containing protein n=1 Tax=Paludihabitans sp. MB14-C6 TaxID=3070656 RepID=UPI0027DE18AE|nr:ATP-binding cassette domain-containing protein [Paludicola sp. MB14-C6]WMJ22029.1 ATP-binding cassette domain-containing protein [Paludicola sp. MB14-C6]